MTKLIGGEDLESRIRQRDRCADLETALGVLIEYVENVGCYDKNGSRLTARTPAVARAHAVLGEEAFQRVMAQVWSPRPSKTAEDSRVRFCSPDSGF